MLKRSLAGALVLLLAAAAAPLAQSAIHVTPLLRDGRVHVSFTLADAFDNEEIRAAIHSGMTITFVYDVELRRSAPLWMDRTLDAATISAGVQFDNLARRYHLTLYIDGRLEDTDVKEREEQVRRWLTEFQRLNLFSSSRLEPNIEYYVRVRARTTPRNTSFVFPWRGADIAGLAKFTYLR